MANAPKNEPLSELVTGIFSDISTLVRKEIELAKTEASEKLDQLVGSLELLLVGAVFSIGAVGVLLSALVTGLAALFVNQGMDGANATALAAAIVGLLFAVIGWLLVARGLHALRIRNLKMTRTTNSMRRDIGVVKEKI